MEQKIDQLVPAAKFLDLRTDTRAHAGQRGHGFEQGKQDFRAHLAGKTFSAADKAGRRDYILRPLQSSFDSDRPELWIHAENVFCSAPSTAA